MFAEEIRTVSDDTRKCSSCKCVKPIDNYLPINVKGKIISPKTCLACRTRRNDYYSKYECNKKRKRSFPNRSEAKRADTLHIKRMKSNLKMDENSIDTIEYETSPTRIVYNNQNLELFSLAEQDSTNGVRHFGELSTIEECSPCYYADADYTYDHHDISLREEYFLSGEGIPETSSECDQLSYEYPSSEVEMDSSHYVDPNLLSARIDYRGAVAALPICFRNSSLSKVLLIDDRNDEMIESSHLPPPLEEHTWNADASDRSEIDEIYHKMYQELHTPHSPKSGSDHVTRKQHNAMEKQVDSTSVAGVVQSYVRSKVIPVFTNFQNFAIWDTITKYLSDKSLGQFYEPVLPSLPFSM